MSSRRQDLSIKYLNRKRVRKKERRKIRKEERVVRKEMEKRKKIGLEK